MFRLVCLLFPIFGETTLNILNLGVFTLFCANKYISAKEIQTVLYDFGDQFIYGKIGSLDVSIDGKVLFIENSLRDIISWWKSDFYMKTFCFTPAPQNVHLTADVHYDIGNVLHFSFTLLCSLLYRVGILNSDLYWHGINLTFTFTYLRSYAVGAHFNCLKKGGIFFSFKSFLRLFNIPPITEIGYTYHLTKLLPLCLL